MAYNPVGASHSFHSRLLPLRLQAMLIAAVTLVQARARFAQASQAASNTTGSAAPPGQRSGSASESPHHGRSTITRTSSASRFLVPRGVAAEATPP